MRRTGGRRRVGGGIRKCSRGWGGCRTKGGGGGGGGWGAGGRKKKGGGGVGGLMVLVVSILVFIGVGLPGSASSPGDKGSRSWEALALLVPILLFHELGHYLAMRIFGYRNVRMFFIPLLGA